eukprot:6577-Heterococcus_DN1.PRE.2
MARKKAQKKQKQETTLVLHRAPNLNALLDGAKSGDSALAVKAYLDAGGSADVLVRKGGTADAEQQIPLLLYMALRNRHPHKELAACLKLLTDAGADISCLGFDGRTALMCACERSCCCTLTIAFLQNGADVLIGSPSNGKTALHYAAATGHSHNCELLLAKENSLVHVRDATGWTPLMCAASAGSFRTANTLCQHGADVNAVTDDGCSPLMAAVKHNSTALVQLLLGNGADIRHTANDGQNTLLIAASEGQVSMMEFLVQRGLSIHTVTKRGSKPLSIAVSYGHKTAAEWLLQHGADVNARNKHGATALHCACVDRDDPAMVELLLAKGANVHMRAEFNQTALDMAARNGRIECAKLLIAAKSDVKNSLTSGETSLHKAVTHHHSAVAQLLLEHGATAVMNDVIRVWCAHGEYCCAGQTALMLCSTVDTVKVLLAARANVHVTTNAGDTCLHKAARHGLSAPVVCLLIKAGADIHAVNNRGQTAAQVAQDNGHTLIEQLLNRAAKQGIEQLLWKYNLANSNSKRSKRNNSSSKNARRSNGSMSQISSIIAAVAVAAITIVLMAAAASLLSK